MPRRPAVFLMSRAGRRVRCAVDAERVFALTGGNPYFVGELVATADAARVPPIVVDAVTARLRRLDPSTASNSQSTTSSRRWSSPNAQRSSGCGSTSRSSAAPAPRASAVGRRGRRHQVPGESLPHSQAAALVVVDRVGIRRGPRRDRAAARRFAILDRIGASFTPPRS
ncbi:hypothetical protein [Agromyces bauzanensis]|uniref:hypothetical protein n=1 Tax=Agromyces bauzanensis TaxID=1308924 RepID=UPI00166E701B|nr:hypothetical protein [Agromyces bauzanensis]